MEPNETPFALWTNSPHALPYLRELFASVEAEIVREARTMWQKQVGGQWLLYTDSRWIGNIDKGIMWFSNQDTALCQAIWETYNTLLKAYDTHLYGQDRFPLEKDLVTAVISVLTLEGWTCRTEVQTLFGRIDILAQKQSHVWLIEAKLSTGAQAMSHALGQLLAGQEAYPTARLRLVTAEPVPVHWLRLFARHNIDLVEGPWTKTP